MHSLICNNSFSPSIKQKFSEVDTDISKRDATYRTNLQTKCASGCDRSSNIHKTIKPNLPKPATPNTHDSTKQEKVTISTEGPHNTRGPKRRIPRPTSMLRPKLIGKSVEGSAMEAVKASRLRARSSRPLPPQRSVSGSGKLPSNNTQNKEKERTRTKKANLTVAKDVGMTSISRLVPVASQTKLINDLSTLFKTTIPNSLSPKFNQLSIQAALQKLPLITRKDSEQMQLTHVFANCFGNYLGSHSAELFSCDRDDDLVSSFLCQVSKKMGHEGLIPDNALRNSIFVARELASTAVYQATVLLRLSLTFNTRKKAYAFNCRAWLVIGQNTVHNSKDTHGYARQCDQKAAIIEALADDFMVRFVI